MRKIAILNFKGGTGKTTTAVNLGHALSLKDYKVFNYSNRMGRLIQNLDLFSE